MSGTATHAGQCSDERLITATTSNPRMYQTVRNVQGQQG